MQYSIAEKMHAGRGVAEKKVTASYVARRMGVSRSTVSRWAANYSADLAQRKLAARVVSYRNLTREITKWSLAILESAGVTVKENNGGVVLSGRFNSIPDSSPIKYGLRELRGENVAVTYQLEMLDKNQFVKE